MCELAVSMTFRPNLYNFRLFRLSWEDKQERCGTLKLSQCKFKQPGTFKEVIYFENQIILAEM